MTTENQVQENAASNEQGSDSGEPQVKTDAVGDGGEGGSSTSEGEFDAASYEESFGLPNGTLDGVKDAGGALETIREYTDKTLTAGLLSNAIDGVTPAVDGETNGGVDKNDKASAKQESKNPELDALRADLVEVKEKLATREKLDHNTRVAEINNRVDVEMDVWASPKYGTSKSRNYKQASAVKELQGLVQTHIAGFQTQGKQPPVVEKLLRQVRAFHDDEYSPPSAKKNSGEVLGSPGTGSRSAKKDDGEPANIHEALQQNSF